MIVDSGNNAYNKDQAELFFSAMAQMGYAAVGIGPNEVRLGADFYQPAKAARVPVVAPEAAGLQDGAVSYVLKDVGGVKVGIVAFNAVAPEDDTIAQIKKRLEAYSEARRKSEILIVLDQAQKIDTTWLETMGKRFGEPDIVISGFKYTGDQNPQTIGKTFMPVTSIRGSHVGVITVELSPGETPKYTLNRTELNENVAEDPDMLKLVEDYNRKQQVPPSTQEGAVSKPAAAPPAPPTASPVRQTHYVTSIICKRCHESEYDSWSKSKHAQALTTLTSQGKALPECLKCHSEQYRRTARYQAPGGLPTGVECASCHSGVLPHGKDYKNTGRPVKDVNVCLDCHDKANSPNFDVRSYWPRAAHGAIISQPS